MSKSSRDRKIKAARQVAETLKSEKRHFEAQKIDELIRAHQSLAENANRLWHDNMNLREIE